MLLNNTINIITLLIASLALVLSVISFIFTVLRGPSIKMLCGENILLAYTSDSHLFILSNFVFFNTGAQPGAVIELEGTLKKGRGSQPIDLRWADFYEEQFPQEEEGIWDISQRTNPYTIVVSGQAAGGIARESIGLRSSSQVETQSLQDGDYTLILRGLIGPGFHFKCKASFTLKLSEDDAIPLDQDCAMDKEDGKTQLLCLRRNKQALGTFSSSKL